MSPWQKSCSTQFLFIVPLTPFPLGNFQPWDWELDKDNYWKPYWGQGGSVLAVNAPFFGLIGLAHSPFQLLHWPEPTSLCWFPGPPQVWNFFFVKVGGGIALQPTLVTDPTKQPREENTLSIIYTSVPDTRRGNKKKAACEGEDIFVLLFCVCFSLQNRRTNKNMQWRKFFSPCAAGMKT